MASPYFSLTKVARLPVDGMESGRAFTTSEGEKTLKTSENFNKNIKVI